MEGNKHLSIFLTIISIYEISASFPVPRSSIAHTRADGIDYRLPTHVKPIHYDITIQPDLENFTFSGLVIIQVEVLEDASNITLHANELNVTYLALMTASSQLIEPASVTNDEDRQFLIINFEETLAAGTYYINTFYEGVVNNGTTGFYRASYVDVNGTTR